MQGDAFGGCCEQRLSLLRWVHQESMECAELEETEETRDARRTEQDCEWITF